MSTGKTCTVVAGVALLIIITLAGVCYFKWSLHNPGHLAEESFGDRTALYIVNGLITFILEAQGANTPYLNPSPISAKLEQAYPEIAREVQAYVRDNAFRDVPEFGSLDSRQSKLSGHDSKAWKVLVFKYYKDYNKYNCSHFKKTCSLLRSMPEVNLAMLSIMEGGKKLFPHQGPFKGIERIHLAIDIPPPSAVLTVDGIEYEWVPGKCVSFDDTFVHSVHNKSSSYRVILFIDTIRREIPPWLRCIFAHPAAAEYLNSINQKIEDRARG